MNKQLEPMLSRVFSEIHRQPNVRSELTPAIYRLARMLSLRYRVSLEDADLLVCISAIQAIATSLIFVRSGCPLSNERTALDAFLHYALAIVDVEDFRRNPKSINVSNNAIVVTIEA
jgi:hypothetical protein